MIANCQPLTRERASRIISRHESMVVACTYNILFTNDICCGQVIEALQAMKRTPHYRHEAKMHMNRAEKARKHYERVLNRVISDRCDFFADANDKFLQNVSPHVEVMYYSIKRELDRHGIEYSSEVARMELARTLCRFACVQFDRRMEHLRRTDGRFACFTLGYLRLTELDTELDAAMDSVRVGRKVDLNTEECQMAMDALSLKLGDIELIANAIQAQTDN